MSSENQYFVLRKKAVPEILLKVVEAKRLLESGRGNSVQEVTAKLGISRSSYYKYKEDIFPFHDNVRGRTVTLMLQLEDIPGLLSALLNKVAEYKANILTIHQAIPVNGMASVTLSIEVLPATDDIAQMVAQMEEMNGVHHITILSRE